ncbi:MAG TPA: type II secretion system F family protein [Bryobacteraceae bacterium]|jgi:tight adherence protein B|nr:type II secretion system F family protein [Bryobacteraceae bacterium]
MVTMIAVVFCAVFAITALLTLAAGGGPSREMQNRLTAIEGEPAPTALTATATNIRREDVARTKWLDRWLTRLNLAARTRLLLHQADVKTPPEKLLAIALIGWASFAGGLYLRTRHLLPSLVIAAGTLPVPLFYVLRRRACRLAKFEQQLPETLDMMVSALQAGHSLITAIGALGQDCPEPIGSEFRMLFDEQNFGLDLRSAMTNFTARVPLQDVRIFVAAALIQKESGGNLAEVLSKVALTTRDRFRLKKQISVHTAQGRITGRVLAFLPVALGFGMYLVNPAGMSVLWTRPAGLKLLYTAGVMVLIGFIVIRRIVRIRV